MLLEVSQLEKAFLIPRCDRIYAPGVELRGKGENWPHPFSSFLQEFFEPLRMNEYEERRTSEEASIL